jgi:hypothetical protein
MFFSYFKEEFYNTQYTTNTDSLQKDILGNLHTTENR